MTENHGYNTPKQGTTDWNVPLNRNFERLDRDVEIRGVKSDLSQYAPKAGAKFLAVDTGEQWFGDGDQWNAIPTPATDDNSSDDTGGESVPIQGAEYRSSEEGTAQAAIDAASSGDTAILDQSETVSSPIAPKSGVNIVGESIAADYHISVADGADCNPILTRNLSDVHLYGVAVDGNRLNQPNGDSVSDQRLQGIGSNKANSIRNLTIENCVVRNGVDGILLRAQGGSTNDIRGVTIRNCRVDNSLRHGIYIGEYNDIGGTLTELLVEECTVTNTQAFIGITYQGIGTTKVTNSTIRNNHVEGVCANGHPDAVGGEGIYFENAVEDCIIEANEIVDCQSGAGAVTMAGACKRNIARNNDCHDTFGAIALVNLWHGTSVVPEGNNLTNNTGANLSAWCIRVESTGSRPAVPATNTITQNTFRSYTAQVRGGDRATITANSYN